MTPAPHPSLDGPGTAEAEWRSWAPLRHLTRWVPQRPASGRTVVVAPHPDDEILGPGGTLALMAAAGTDITVVAVTDGEASHPGRQADLRRIRPAESARAAGCLGIAARPPVRLAHPDGGIDEARLVTELSLAVGAGDLVLAPWSFDGHPDHDRTGRAALVAAQRCGAVALAYLVWAWHWAVPGQDLPWERACRVDLRPEIERRKREAARCFATQINGPDPVLPVAVLERLTRPYEVFLRP